MYIISPPYQRAYCSKPKRAVYDTPCRASPLLCSWQLNWNLRDSRIVKTKAYSYALICICRPDLLPSCGLSARVTVAKIVIISISRIKKMEFFFMKAMFFRFLFVFVDIWIVFYYCCPIKTQNHVLGSVTCYKLVIVLWISILGPFKSENGKDGCSVFMFSTLFMIVFSHRPSGSSTD